MNDSKTSALEYVFGTFLAILVIGLFGFIMYSCSAATRGMMIKETSALEAAAKPITTT